MADETAPLPSLRPEQSLGYMIHYVGRLFARAMGAEAARHGVQLGAVPVLLALWEVDGQTQAELADRVQIEHPTMTATLGRMERDGLVTRKTDAVDRRARRVHLTPRGAALRPAIIGAAHAINARAVSKLESIDGAVLLDALHDVAAALEAPTVPQGDPT